MSAGIEIFVPAEKGSKAQVNMPYAPPPANAVWLHAAVDTKKPTWDRELKRWLIPRGAALRVFDAATAAGRKASVTRQFKADAEKCTTACQTAKVTKRDECVCICGGEFHGQRSSRWRHVTGEFLVRSSGEFTTSTRHNEF